MYIRWEDYLQPPLSVANVTFLQIGANCGANTPECAGGGDPIWPYATQCGWSGVAIEPVKKTFHQLCQNYVRVSPGVQPLRALVGAVGGGSEALVVSHGETSHAATTDEAQHAAHAPRSNHSHHAHGTLRRTRGAPVERVPAATLREVWPSPSEFLGGERAFILVVDVEGHEPILLGSADLPTPLCDTRELSKSKCRLRLTASAVRSAALLANLPPLPAAC